jgi:hypothetical protein
MKTNNNMFKKAVSNTCFNAENRAFSSRHLAVNGFKFIKDYFFRRSRISVKRTASFVGAGGGAGTSSFFFLPALIALISAKTTKATIKKSKVAWRKLP